MEYHFYVINIRGKWRLKKTNELPANYTTFARFGLTTSDKKIAKEIFDGTSDEFKAKAALNAANNRVVLRRGNSIPR